MPLLRFLSGGCNLSPIARVIVLWCTAFNICVNAYSWPRFNKVKQVPPRPARAVNPVSRIRVDRVLQINFANDSEVGAKKKKEEKQKQEGEGG